MIHPLPLGFGWSRGSDPGTFRLWRGERIVASTEITSRLQVQLGVSLRFTPGDDSVLGLFGPLGSAFLVVEACPLKDWRGGARQIEARLYGNTDGILPELILSTSLWANPDEWRSGEPRWRRLYVPLVERAVGRATHTERTLEERTVSIPFPEGPCEATVRLYESTWSWPRWPWPKTLRRAEVTPVRAPVVPGKGESGYDLDDDGLYSLCCPARSVEEAAGKFLASALETRQRRAGSWTYPAREAAAAE